MSKLLKNRNLHEQSGFRALLALSLCASMAAFGCTTDRNLGNGNPVVTPGLRNSPTSGTSAGSESESVPPPMMSSFSNGSVEPRIARMSALEVAAILAQQQPRVRILGPVSPDNGGRPYGSDRMIPQQQVTQQYSVNSTLYSAPTEAVTSGAGEAVGSTDAVVFDTNGVVIDNSGFTAASTIAGSSVVTGTTTANSGMNVTNAAAPVIAPSGTAITPTSNAMTAPTGFASVRTLSPTAASVVNPPASISGSPAVAATSSSRTAGTANRTTTNPSNATVSSSTVSATTSVGVANPVRVLNANGRVTMTNSAARQQ